MNDPLREPTSILGTVECNPLATVGEAKAFQEGFRLGRSIGEAKGELSAKEERKNDRPSTLWAFIAGAVFLAAVLFVAKALF